jgi:RNA polymerase sigma factor (sigma-70 family)
MKVIYLEKDIIEDLESLDSMRNNRAFKYLYKRHYAMAISIIIKNNGYEEDAKEVFQDALIALYENIKNRKFRKDSSIKTYLYSMIRNIWLNALKKNRIINEGEQFEEKYSQITDNDSFDHDDVKSFLLKKLLDKIGTNCKKILQYYYYHQMSMSDIMQNMGFSNEHSAKTQKYKCMQKLIAFINSKPAIKESLK